MHARFVAFALAMPSIFHVDIPCRILSCPIFRPSALHSICVEMMRLCVYVVSVLFAFSSNFSRGKKIVSFSLVRVYLSRRHVGRTIFFCVYPTLIYRNSAARYTTNNTINSVNRLTLYDVCVCLCA